MSPGCCKCESEVRLQEVDALLYGFLLRQRGGSVQVPLALLDVLERIDRHLAANVVHAVEPNPLARPVPALLPVGVEASNRIDSFAVQVPQHALDQLVGIEFGVPQHPIEQVEHRHGAARHRRVVRSEAEHPYPSQVIQLIREEVRKVAGGPVVDANVPIEGNGADLLDPLCGHALIDALVLRVVMLRRILAENNADVVPHPIDRLGRRVGDLVGKGAELHVRQFSCRLLRDFS